MAEVVDANGCVTGVSIEVLALPYPTLVVDTITTTCYGEIRLNVYYISETDTINAPGPTTYTWNPNTNSRGDILDERMIGFLNAGEYKLRFIDGNNCIIDTSFIVNPFSIPLTSISLLEKEISVVGTQTKTLTVIFNPTDACNQDLIWRSKDATIAAVTNGIVTGVSNGETYVVVTSDEGGFQDSCKIKVFGAGINSLAKSDNGLLIYPNPASTQLHVKYSSYETGNYSIFNVVGQVVMSASTSPSSTPTPLPPQRGENSPPLEGLGEVIIDISHLSKGMYYIKILDKMGRFVKE
jgi:uncharacterized protein YjdB